MVEAGTITEVGAETAATMTGTTPGIGTAEGTTRTTITDLRGTITTGTRVVGRIRAPAEDTTSGTIRTIRITGIVARRTANAPVRTTRHRELAAVTIVLAAMAEITTAATEARPAAGTMTTTRRRRRTTSATTATAEPEMITTRRRRWVEREATGSITAAVAGAAEVAESATRAATRWARPVRWDRRGFRAGAVRAR